MSKPVSDDVLRDIIIHYQGWDESGAANLMLRLAKDLLALRKDFEKVKLLGLKWKARITKLEAEASVRNATLSRAQLELDQVKAASLANLRDYDRMQGLR